MNYNPFSLAGKKILITGASSGIGRNIAIECSRMGADLVITGRNRKKLEDTLSCLEIGNHQLIAADLTKEQDLNLLIDNVELIDGLVHSAGVPVLVSIKHLNEQILDDVFSINTKAPLLLSSSLVKNKKINKGASIVFISSISGTSTASVGESPYSASKAAINGFLKVAALEFANQKIRVNSVNPGLISTDLLDNAKSLFSEKELYKKLEEYPLKRIGKPEDVSYAVIFLLSDAANWITGTSMIIDGGYTIR